MASGDGKCPDTFYCSNGSRGFSAIPPSLLSLPTYSGLVSSFFSCLGAALIVLAYCVFKDLRKGTAQKIITLLALADFITAVSGIYAASIFIPYSAQDHYTEMKCNQFDIHCQIQGLLFVWSALCGFIWNAILAIHFLFATVFSRSTWSNRLLPLYNIIGWGLPLAMVLPLLIQDRLGFEPDLRYSCFMRWTIHSTESDGYIILGLWWIPELVCTSTILLCYTLILMYISCQQACRLPSTQRVNKRMLAILLAFLLLRTCDFIQMISVFDPKYAILACSDPRAQIFGLTVSVFQAASDTGQGWVNCFLYIFLSTEIRRRMFVLPFRRIVNAVNFSLDIGTTESAVLIGNTQITISTRAKAREKGETYVSFPTEFPRSVEGPLEYLPDSLEILPDYETASRENLLDLASDSYHLRLQ